MVLYKDLNRDFLGGRVVKNPPSNGGNVGSTPGQGTKIPHTVGQLSSQVTSREACMSPWSPTTAKKNKTMTLIISKCLPEEWNACYKLLHMVWCVPVYLWISVWERIAEVINYKCRLFEGHIISCHIMPYRPHHIMSEYKAYLIPLRCWSASVPGLEHPLPSETTCLLCCSLLAVRSRVWPFATP